eukprot:scaffold34440_cov45-Cyclotella_meneghiniana.AAC.5
MGGCHFIACEIAVKMTVNMIHLALCWATTDKGLGVGAMDGCHGEPPLCYHSRTWVTLRD